MQDSGTRERIISTAQELFHQQGYGATGIAQILKQSGAKTGSLYYFFPTKEDLLLAVLERYKAGLWPELLQPIFDRISDPIERIFGLLDGYRQVLMATGCTYGCPIAILALEISESHPAARKLVAENFIGWRDAVKGCLEQAAPRLPENVNLQDIAEFVLTVMEGGVMQARTYRSIEPFESAVAILRDYFERLIQDGTTWSTARSVGHHATVQSKSRTLNKKQTLRRKR